MTSAAPETPPDAPPDLRACVTSALSALRCTFLEKRDHIETCRKEKRGLYARTDAWFASQTARLADIEFAGAEFAFIVTHWDSYLKWRESVGRGA